MTEAAHIAVIPGDGIGVEVTEAALHLADRALARVGLPALRRDVIAAGAEYYKKTGQDIEPDGEARAGRGEAIFLGAIGLPSVRHADGTEISPHLRLRDLFQLYAGVRPVKAYPNAPQRLADPRAAGLDLVILRESTEGLFYSAAVHGRAEVFGDEAVHDIMRISRTTTEKLHRFGFRLAEKRRARGRPGVLTCVDKANVFTSQAFFRKIYDEVAGDFPDAKRAYAYVDAMALDLVRKPWEADVLVMENIFGDILSDLAGGLVGGMGMAACGEYGDDHALFQPAHGSAPDIMGQDKANPLAAVLSGAMMLEWLGERRDEPAYDGAARLIEAAVERGFAEGELRPMEFGGDMGCRAMVAALEARI
ncbi:isocitrate/isopropylmalate dehydrogenase family protein [Pseudaestuariivita atlantica]|uniref:3-isopropylmalate dehydrogenase n=1 Tax=Pseudaestuariivita atlantica TaxID=1317121 RepID=A0A0L1JNG9_9RHOB|nr:isocitrate/isopropylmalate family dehydrogenase [Pseudaestuariivita atlantica]KNG93306.1 3-isopropylmalate dehydrogenase [Pseudaestuariivita atlantica]